MTLTAILIKTKINCIVFLSAIFFLFTPKTMASHLEGGDISWECLSNGNYIFYLNLYMAYEVPLIGTRIIDYQAGQIVVQIDSSRYHQFNDSLNCNYIDGMLLTFKSSEISLGPVPSNGFLFTYTECCMAGGIQNVKNSAAQGIIIRSKMYNTGNSSSGDCHGSSPMFAEAPERFIIQNAEYNFANPAFDYDKDSLVYSFDTPWTSPNKDIQWETGYSSNAPFPGTSHNALNIAPQLNSSNGSVSGKIMANITGFYAYSLRIDAYREGARVASVWRNAKIYAFDSAITFVQSQNHPHLKIDSNTSNTYVLNVTLGDSLSIPVIGMDIDSVLADTTNPNSLFPQEVFLTASGMMFSDDFSSSGPCLDSNSECASLEPAPVIDTNGIYTLKDSGKVQTWFNWKTSCALLDGMDSSYSDVNTRLFNFTFKLDDRECPSAYQTKTLSIYVNRYLPHIQQQTNILSTAPADSYQWFYNGNPIANTDTNKIAVSSAGSYAVEVVKNGCASQRAVYRFGSVGLEEKSPIHRINVYPNPSNGKFIIESQNLESELRLQLLDFSGKLLSEQVFEQSGEFKKELDFSHFTAGIYLLKLQSLNAVEIRKLVIK